MPWMPEMIPLAYPARIGARTGGDRLLTGSDLLLGLADKTWRSAAFFPRCCLRAREARLLDDMASTVRPCPVCPVPIALVLADDFVPLVRQRRACSLSSVGTNRFVGRAAIDRLQSRHWQAMAWYPPLARGLSQEPRAPAQDPRCAGGAVVPQSRVSPGPEVVGRSAPCGSPPCFGTGGDEPAPPCNPWPLPRAGLAESRPIRVRIFRTETPGFSVWKP